MEENKKMADSQSRYSIMDELNTRKIKARESLSKLESDMDERVWQTEKSIKQYEQEIKEKESSYVMDYKVAKREEEVQLKMMQQELQRNVERRQALIKTLDDSYEQEFQNWKKTMKEEISSSSKGLDRYKETQSAKIKEKETIIKEIESSIKNLMDMSKETTKAQ